MYICVCSINSRNMVCLCVCGVWYVCVVHVCLWCVCSVCHHRLSEFASHSVRLSVALYGYSRAVRGFFWVQGLSLGTWAFSGYMGFLWVQGLSLGTGAFSGYRGPRLFPGTPGLSRSKSISRLLLAACGWNLRSSEGSFSGWLGKMNSSTPLRHSR